MHVDSPSLLLENKLAETAALIGQTPLIEITGLVDSPAVKLFAKAEWMQLGGSVKARAAFGIISSALVSGKWKPGQRLLDATSGNTGIAFAAVCARLGLPLTICIPENASAERKLILQSLGAELIYTSRFEGTDGAQLVAKELLAGDPDRYFYADQYNNDANWQAHVSGTGPEIWQQTGGAITHFAAGLGTTGTLVGTGRYFRANHPQVTIVALHPDSALHGLEGWKDLETARVPGIYDDQVAHQNLSVSTEDAYEMVCTLAKTQGLLLSPSSAANVAGALKVAQGLESGVVVTVLPDDASKYAEVMKNIFPT